MFATLGRRLRAVAVVVALSAGLTAAVGTPANAAFWAFIENFEGDPAATWWFEGGPGVFSDRNGFAHSGTHYADITRATAGWTSVDHSLTLPSGLSRSCRASAFFFGGGSPIVRLEIINAADWTYVAMGTFDLPDSYEFQQKTITWSSGIGPRNVVFRAVVINPGDGAVRVKIDDVGVACSTYP
jgi:hypothetical protein